MARRPGLERDLAKLASLQLELRTTLDRVDRTLKRLASEAGPDGAARPVLTPIRPLRVQVLEMLHELDVMAYSRELIAYAFARYDLVIPPSRFGSLSSDEQQAYGRRDAPRSRNRTLWLCFGLRHDDGAPVRRLLGRSDWTMDKRMWAPTTGRVQHLRILARLCELALDEHVHFANPDALGELIQAYARDLPVKTLPGVHAYAEWQERAITLLQNDDLEATDYDLRQQAAERWSGLSEKHQLFGLEALESPDPAGDLESVD